MDISIFLAKAFGLYLVIVSLPFIFYQQAMRSIINELISNRAVFLMTALFTLVLGIILILVHNIWTADWRVVITVLCWLTFVKGIVRLYFSDYTQQWMRKFQNKTSFIVIGCICFLLGVALLYMGFWVG